MSLHWKYLKFWKSGEARFYTLPKVQRPQTRKWWDQLHGDKSGRNEKDLRGQRVEMGKQLTYCQFMSKEFIQQRQTQMYKKITAFL